MQLERTDETGIKVVKLKTVCQRMTNPEAHITPNIGRKTGEKIVRSGRPKTKSETKLPPIELLSAVLGNTTAFVNSYRGNETATNGMQSNGTLREKGKR